MTFEYWHELIAVAKKLAGNGTELTLKKHPHGAGLITAYRCFGSALKVVKNTAFPYDSDDQKQEVSALISCYSEAVRSTWDSLSDEQRNCANDIKVTERIGWHLPDNEVLRLIVRMSDAGKWATDREDNITAYEAYQRAHKCFDSLGHSVVQSIPKQQLMSLKETVSRNCDNAWIALTPQERNIILDFKLLDHLPHAPCSGFRYSVDPCPIGPITVAEVAATARPRSALKY